MSWILANWLESLAFTAGVISVYLSVRQNIWSWPTAIVNVALYFFVFRRERLYADMWLQLVYLVLSIYGWYEWLHGGANRTQLKVSRVTARLSATLLAIAVAAALTLGTYFAGHTNAALPYMDSSLVSVSLVAQWMMTRKLLENWALWIAADVVYVGMFIFKQLYPTALLYAVFLVLAVLGHAQWRRSWLVDRATAAPEPVPA
ncbi:MAG: nicotinamide riboside transporter PnuC [Gemmatimonadales bacterium]